MLLLSTVSLSFGLLYFLKKYIGFLEFILEEKLLRRAAHLSTLFSSGLIFIYFETNKNKFHSSFDFVINIYKQHPVLVTLLTFGFLGIF